MTNRQEFLKKFGESLDEFFKAEQSEDMPKYSGKVWEKFVFDKFILDKYFGGVKDEKFQKCREDFFKYLDDKTSQGESTKIKMMIPQGLQEDFQMAINEFFDGVNSDKEFEERLDRWEDMHTPKYELYQQCREELRGVYDTYISGALPKRNALLLLQSKYHRLIEEIDEIRKRGGFILVDDVPEEFLEITFGITTYYKTMKSYIDSDDEIKTDDKHMEGGKALSDRNSILPPVIQELLKNGLLNENPVNGKYAKKDEKKDKDVIKWVFDNYPIYEDDLTAELFTKYIMTSNKPQTIGVYISTLRSEAKK